MVWNGETSSRGGGGGVDRGRGGRGRHNRSRDEREEFVGSDESLGLRAVEEEEEEEGVKGLLKQAACVDASCLSQLQLESNRQAQEDEVQVLQSIYMGEYISVSGGGDGAVAFIIIVNLDIPDGIKVAAEAPRSRGSGGGSSSSSDDGEDNSFFVEALLPISLLCVFPATYPSHSAPLFEIGCLWLSPRKLSTLCTELDRLWEETSTPEVVVHTWSEFLRTQTLVHVGASEKLQLEPNEKGSEDLGLDERAVSGSESFDVDIFRLLLYNEKRFLESLQRCGICFLDFLGSRFTRFPCRHDFCKSCVQQYYNLKVKEGNVMNLTCPAYACKESVPPAMLQEILNEEAFDRYLKLLLQKALDSMPDVVCCPKCKTRSIEGPDHFVQCSECRFSFCSLCMSNWHPAQNCKTLEEKLWILRARRQKGGAGEEMSKEERELINEKLDRDYIEKETKPCPTCKKGLQRSGGCKKMTCPYCKTYFCYQCGQAIKGYSHYRSSTRCVLFDNITPEELQYNFEQLQEQQLQEQQHNPRMQQLQEQQLVPHINPRMQQLQEQQLVPRNPRRQQLRVQQPVPHNPRGAEGNAAARPCPNCKHVNQKVRGNNHMLCGVCGKHYCGLCNEMVRRGEAHFGVNKCSQHT
ncbi:hypothetical protein KC19_1G132500 [Ceratodon purpureus]|uniref:RBR-type E3 ubiquitin transferase n=1 Tax=Ceratodon purpureus TaxID=3225 RepID=A0A8T0J7Z2_CERPU|nr:hypothetical protein KC19_1G132500 [Ceratodon purpureus]